MYQVTPFMVSLSAVLLWMYGLNVKLHTIHTSHHPYVTPFLRHTIHGVIIIPLFFFTDLNILFTGTKISCTSSPVYEGETASVTCHFNSNLRETKNNFFVYRTFKTDGKRRHGNTLHTNFFSTCKTILKISTMPVYS